LAFSQKLSTTHRDFFQLFSVPCTPLLVGFDSPVRCVISKKKNVIFYLLFQFLVAANQKKKRSLRRNRP